MESIVMARYLSPENPCSRLFRWSVSHSLCLRPGQQATMHERVAESQRRSLSPVIRLDPVFLTIPDWLDCLPGRVPQCIQRLFHGGLRNLSAASNRSNGVQNEATQKPPPHLPARRRVVEQIDRHDLVANGHRQPHSAFGILATVPHTGRCAAWCASKLSAIAAVCEETPSVACCLSTSSHTLP